MQWPLTHTYACLHSTFLKHLLELPEEGKPTCVVQEKHCLMGACGSAPLSVLTTAFHNLFCSLNHTHLWPYVGLLPSLVTTVPLLIAQRAMQG